MTEIWFIENSAESSAGALKLRGGSCASLRSVVFAYNICTNPSVAGGGAVFCYESSPTFTECTFVGNESRFGGAMTIGVWAYPILTNLTFYGNSAEYGSALYIYYEAYPVMERSIVANNGTGGSMYFHNQCEITLSCCNIYGNTGGDWTPRIAAQYGIRGNFSMCPSFCNADVGDFQLCDQSPCLPGNHPDGYDCGVIGAWGQDCICGPSSSKPTTWGAIKSTYR
jgi:hypothetical protein